jgi:hypothetical protein
MFPFHHLAHRANSHNSRPLAHLHLCHTNKASLECMAVHSQPSLNLMGSLHFPRQPNNLHFLRRRNFPSNNLPLFLTNSLGLRHHLRNNIHLRVVHRTLLQVSNFLHLVDLSTSLHFKQVRRTNLVLALHLCHSTRRRINNHLRLVGLHH